MKRALIIRHVPFEGVAGFRLPIEQAGYVIDRIDVADPAFPAIDLRAPDLVVMMGGPMGVYEQDRHPWIACQITRLRERLAADRPTLGVCLGSQMIAAALGAGVYPGPAKEVGFAPLSLHATGVTSPLRHLIDLPVLHWHGDTFDLPEGVEPLARSALYRNQAFRRGRTVLALQFHAEMGEDERFAVWLAEADDAYLAAAGTDRSRLEAEHAALGSPLVAGGRAMLGEWLAALPA